MHSEQEFAELLLQARAGDAGARERLLAGHLQGLRAYLRLNAGPALRARESCSDLAQSVCRELLEDLGDCRASAEPAFRQWLYTLALRKILDRRKFYDADRRAAVHEVRADAAETGEQQLLAAYATLTTPSQQAAAREEIARIEAAFDQLSPEHREVITLARLMGLSAAEIAERQGRTEEAVRMLLHRARARLARVLG